jgi:hypothetical protein
LVLAKIDIESDKSEEMIRCEGYCYWRPISGSVSRHDSRELLCFYSDGQVAIEKFDSRDAHITTKEGLAADAVELRNKFAELTNLDLSTGIGRYSIAEENISFTVFYGDGSVTYTGSLTSTGMHLDLLSEHSGQLEQITSGLEYFVSAV